MGKIVSKKDLFVDHDQSGAATIKPPTNLVSKSDLLSKSDLMDDAAPADTTVPPAEANTTQPQKVAAATTNLASGIKPGGLAEAWIKKKGIGAADLSEYAKALESPVAFSSMMAKRFDPENSIERKVIPAVKKAKNLTTDEDALSYIHETSNLQSNKAKYADDLKSFGINSADDLLSRPINDIVAWHKKESDGIEAQLDQTNQQIQQAFDQPESAIGIGASLVQRRDELARKKDALQKIKDDVLTLKFKDTPNALTAGLEYTKAFAPEKFSAIATRLKLPSNATAQQVANIPFNEMKLKLPQNMMYDVEMEGAKIRVKGIADQSVDEGVRERVAQKSIMLNRTLKQLSEIAKKADPASQKQLIAAAADAMDKYQKDTDVASMHKTDADVLSAVADMATIAQKYPEVAGRQQAMDNIKDELKGASWFERNIFGTTGKADVIGGKAYSAAYGVLPTVAHALASTGLQTVQAVNSVLGSIGVKTKADSYLDNIALQEHYDDRFLNPRQVYEVDKVKIPEVFQKIAKEAGVKKEMFSDFGTDTTYKFNWKSIPDVIGETSGQILGQAVLSEISGGLLAGAASKGFQASASAAKLGFKVADVGSKAEGISLKAASGFSKIAKFVKDPEVANEWIGLFASTYATTYSQNYQQGIDAGLSDSEATSYAHLTSIGTALTEHIASPMKQARRVFGAETQGGTMRNVINILNDGNLTKGQRFADATGYFLRNAYKGIRDETVEEVADVLKTSVLDNAYGINTSQMGLWDNVKQTAVQTALGMMPMAIAGAFGGRSKFRQQSLWQAGTETEKFRQFLQDKIDNSKTPEAKDKAQGEMDNTMKIANTMTSIISNLPEKNSQGREFTEGEKMEMAEQIFKRRKLQNDARTNQNADIPVNVQPDVDQANTSVQGIVNGTAPHYSIDGQSVSRDEMHNYIHSDQYAKDRANVDIKVENDEEVKNALDARNATLDIDAQLKPATQLALPLAEGTEQNALPAPPVVHQLPAPTIGGGLQIEVVPPKGPEGPGGQPQLGDGDANISNDEDISAKHQAVAERVQRLSGIVDTMQSMNMPEHTVNVIRGTLDEAKGELAAINKQLGHEEGYMPTAGEAAPAASAPAANTQPAASLIPVKRYEGEPLRSNLSPQEQAESDKVSTEIKDRFDKAPKVVAEPVLNVILPTGETMSGRYVLVPHKALTASHNPNTFSDAKGFPQTDDGKNPNDRDYTNKKTQASVVSRANKYDGRALQDLPTVTPDGVVIDGNDRTMSGQIAARNKTDEAYDEELRRRLGFFGFTQEDYDYVAKGGRPRLVFVSDQVPAYTTETFAKFNRSKTKLKSGISKAIELSRTVSDKIVRQISSIIEPFEKLASFYDNGAAAKQVKDILMQGGLLSQDELEGYFDTDTNKFSAVGEEFLEGLLIGRVVDENELHLLGKDGMKGYREKIVKTITTLTNINTLGEDVSLKDAISKAIRLKDTLINNTAFQNKKNESGAKWFEALKNYLSQGTMFGEIPDADTVIMFIHLEGSNLGQWVDFLNTYQKSAASTAMGAGMFADEDNSRAAILSRTAQKFDNDRQQIVQKASTSDTKQQSPAAGSDQSGTKPDESQSGGVQGQEKNTPNGQQQGSSKDGSQKPVDANQVLTDYNGRKITRGEFDKWVAQRQVNDKNFVPTSDAVARAFRVGMSAAGDMMDAYSKSPTPKSAASSVLQELASAFQKRFGTKTKVVSQDRAKEILSKDPKTFFFQILDEVDLFDNIDPEAAKAFIYRVFTTVDNEADAKKAFRKLAIKYHPDKAGEAGVEVMKYLNNANDNFKAGTMWKMKPTAGASSGGSSSGSNSSTSQNPGGRQNPGGSSSGQQQQQQQQQRQKSPYEQWFDDFNKRKAEYEQEEFERAENLRQRARERQRQNNKAAFDEQQRAKAEQESRDKGLGGQAKSVWDSLKNFFGKSPSFDEAQNHGHKQTGDAAMQREGDTFIRRGTEVKNNGYKVANEQRVENEKRKADAKEAAFQVRETARKEAWRKYETAGKTEEATKQWNADIDAYNDVYSQSSQEADFAWRKELDRIDRTMRKAFADGEDLIQRGRAMKDGDGNKFFFQVNDSNVPAGFYNPTTGEAYIVDGQADDTSTIHETFSHPLIQAAEQRNPELYNNLLREAKADQQVVDAVNAKYSHDTNRDAEYIAAAIDLEARKQLKNKTLSDYVAEFWNEVKNAVKDIFGGKAAAVENIDATTTIKDLVDFVLKSGIDLNLDPTAPKAEAAPKADVTVPTVIAPASPLQPGEVPAGPFGGVAMDESTKGFEGFIKGDSKANFLKSFDETEYNNLLATYQKAVVMHNAGMDVSALLNDFKTAVLKVVRDKVNQVESEYNNDRLAKSLNNIDNQYSSFNTSSNATSKREQVQNQGVPPEGSNQEHTTATQGQQGQTQGQTATEQTNSGNSNENGGNATQKRKTFTREEVRDRFPQLFLRVAKYFPSGEVNADMVYRIMMQMYHGGSMGLKGVIQSVLPNTVQELNDLIEVARQAEQVISELDVNNFEDQKQDAINAINRSNFSSQEKQFMLTVIESMPKVSVPLKLVAAIAQPTSGDLGFYSWSKRILEANNAVTFVHELGHMAFFEVLSGDERIKYLEGLRDAYNESKSTKLFSEWLRDYIVIKQDKESPFATNSFQNIGEIFAQQATQHVMSAVDGDTANAVFLRRANMLQGFANWIMNLYQKLKDRNLVIPQIRSVLDKAFDSRKLSGVEEITPAPTQAAAVQQGENPVISDGDLRKEVGDNGLSLVKKAEDQGGVPVDRARLLKTAREIARVDGKTGLPLEATAEALQYESGYPDNFEDLRNAIAKGGVELNRDNTERMIAVGVDLPSDILEKYQAPSTGQQAAANQNTPPTAQPEPLTNQRTVNPDNIPEGNSHVGSQVTFKFNGKDVTGTIVEVPGYTDIDFVAVKDTPMSYTIHELASGLEVASLLSVSPFTITEAIDETVKRLEQKPISSEKLFSKLYAAEKNPLTGKDKSVLQPVNRSLSPKYQRWVAAKEAAEAARPLVHTEEERKALLEAADKADAAGAKNAGSFARSMANRKVYNAKEEKTTPERVEEYAAREIKQQIIKNKIAAGEPLAQDEADRSKEPWTRDQFIENVIGPKRLATFPQDRIDQLYNAYKKASEIINYFGYVPEQYKGQISPHKVGINDVAYITAYAVKAKRGTLTAQIKANLDDYVEAVNRAHAQLFGEDKPEVVPASSDPNTPKAEPTVNPVDVANNDSDRKAAESALDDILGSFLDAQPEKEPEGLVKMAIDASKDINELWRAAFLEDPENSLREIAEQLSSSESEAKTTRQTFGDAISDIATALHPELFPVKSPVVPVRQFKVGAGGTAGVFEDKQGNLYKSVQPMNWVPKDGTYVREPIKGEVTNEYNILSSLRGNKSVPVVGDLVNTSSGPAFQIEKLNEVDNLTYDEYRQVQRMVKDLNNQGVFVNDVLNVMRRPETGELVIVDFSHGMKDESLIGNQSYADNVYWNVQSKLPSDISDRVDMEDQSMSLKREMAAFNTNGQYDERIGNLVLGRDGVTHVVENIHEDKVSLRTTKGGEKIDTEITSAQLDKEYTKLPIDLPTDSLTDFLSDDQRDAQSTNIPDDGTVDKLLSNLFTVGLISYGDILSYLQRKGANVFMPLIAAAYRRARTSANISDNIKNSLDNDNTIRNANGRFGLSDESTSTGNENTNGSQSGDTGGSDDGGTNTGQERKTRPGIRYQGVVPTPSQDYIGTNDAIDYHQRLAVNLAIDNFEKRGTSFMLADGPGVGKTRIFLALADYYNKQDAPGLAIGKKDKKILIVSLPETIRSTFIRDAAAMGLNLDDFEIGTYNDLGAGKIGKGDYKLVIYDEGHNLKNLTSKKSVMAADVRSQHTLFASATPMDKPLHATYFLHKVLGISEHQLQDRLGIRTQWVRDRQGNMIPMTFMVNGFETFLERLTDARLEAQEKGSMIRREYPFFGSIAASPLEMQPEMTEKIAAIKAITDQRIEAADNLAIFKFSYDYAKEHGLSQQEASRQLHTMYKNKSGIYDTIKRKISEFIGEETKQFLSNVDKLNEYNKGPYILDGIIKAMANGQSVAVAAQTVNPQTVKVGSQSSKYGFYTETVPSLIEYLKTELDKLGIPTAGIYGGNDAKRTKYVNEMNRFQSGEAPVLLFTAKSGGTGIDLDDQVGDKPRKVFLATLEYGGDTLDQLLGRFSRRNTKSEVEIEIPRFDNAADNNRLIKSQQKSQVMDTMTGGIGNAAGMRDAYTEEEFVNMDDDEQMDKQLEKQPQDIEMNTNLVEEKSVLYKNDNRFRENSGLTRDQYERSKVPEYAQAISDMMDRHFKGEYLSAEERSDMAFMLDRILRKGEYTNYISADNFFAAKGLLVKDNYFTSNNRMNDIDTYRNIFLREREKNGLYDPVKPAGFYDEMKDTQTAKEDATQEDLFNPEFNDDFERELMDDLQGQEDLHMPIDAPDPNQRRSSAPKADFISGLDWGKMNKFTKTFADFMARAKQIIDGVRAKGITIDKTNDFYNLYYLMQNKIGARITELDNYIGATTAPSANSYIRRFQNDFKTWLGGSGKYFNAGNFKPFFTDAAGNKVPMKMEDLLQKFGLYMYAKHAQERNDYVAHFRGEAATKEIDRVARLISSLDPVKDAAKILSNRQYISEIMADRVPEFPLMKDGGSGMTNKQSQEILDAAKDAGLHDMFEDYAAEYRNNIILPNLEAKLKYGLISNKDYDVLLNYYRNYVPLRKDTEEATTSYSTYNTMLGKDLFRTKGDVNLTHEDRVNPVVQAAQNFKNTIILGEGNTVNRALGQLILEFPDNNWRVTTRVNEYDKNGPAARYFYNGQPFYIYIDDDELRKAVTKEDLKSLAALPWAQKLIRYKSKIVTTFTLGFQVNNALSDFFTSQVNLSVEKKGSIRDKARQYAIGGPGVMGAMRSVLKGDVAKAVDQLKPTKFLGAGRAMYAYNQTGEASTEWQDWARRFVLSGGMINYNDNTQHEKTEASITDAFSSEKDVAGKFTKAITWWENTSGAVENGIRLAVFRSLVEEGVDESEAAVHAKNATTDFTKKGTHTAYMNAVYLFFNPSVQGFASQVDRWRKYPQRAAWAAGISFTAGIAMSAINEWFSDCDDKKSPDCYWNLQDWEKENYALMPGPNGFMKFRLPRFWQFFYSNGVTFYDAISGKKNMSDFVRGFINSAYETVSPVSTPAGVFSDKWDANWQMLFPSLLQPFIGQYANKDVFGRPIVKEQPAFTPNKPDSETGSRKASWLSTKAAELMNSATGGTKHEAGAIDVSPDSIEYWLENGFGGIYKTVDQLGDLSEAGIDHLKGDKHPAPVQTKDIPIVGNIYTQSRPYVNMGRIYTLIRRSGKELLTPEEKAEFRDLLRAAAKPEEGSGQPYMDHREIKRTQSIVAKAQNEILKFRKK